MGRKEKKICNPATARYQYGRWRAVVSLVESWEFKDLYAEHGTEEVQKWIDEGNIEQLRHWQKTIKHGPLAEKTVEELRQIASRLHVRYYKKMSKIQLLIAITGRQQNERSVSKNATDSTISEM